jgi:hypothetical protein
VTSPEHLRFTETLRVLPGGEASFEAGLEAGLRLEGIVRAAETRGPLDRAMLYLEKAEDGEGSDRRQRKDGHSLSTGEDGVFRFGGLAPGEYDLLVRHESFYLDAPGGVLRVAVNEAERAPIEVPMKPAGAIRGRLKRRRTEAPASEQMQVVVATFEESEKPASPSAAESPESGRPPTRPPSGPACNPTAASGCQASGPAGTGSKCTICSRDGDAARSAPAVRRSPWRSAPARRRSQTSKPQRDKNSLPSLPGLLGAEVRTFSPGGIQVKSARRSGLSPISRTSRSAFNVSSWWGAATRCSSIAVSHVSPDEEHFLTSFREAS